MQIYRLSAVCTATNEQKKDTRKHTSWLRIQYFRFLRRLSFKWRLHAAQWKMLRRFGRMHVTIHWLTNDSSGCWSKAEVESVSVLQEGLGESGQSYFLHSHHLSHPVGSIVVLEIETVRPSETLRHLTNVNPRLHLSLVYVFRSLYFVSASNVSEKHYCQKGKGTQANSNDKLKLKCTL